jgi:hypothetical protein
MTDVNDVRNAEMAKVRALRENPTENYQAE